MPSKSGKSGFTSRGYGSDRPKLPYFSPKPPKADWKAIKADYDAGCKNAFAVLEKIAPNESIWANYNDDEKTWAVYYRIARTPDSDPIGIICGRSTSYLKALCIVAHWASTMSLDSMFPAAEENEPGW